MARNGADYGIEPTRTQKRIIPRIYDRAAQPKTTDKGDIHAFAVLARKDAPPSEWDVSTPSHDPLKRWFWLFLAVALLIAPLVLK